ncbi:MAG: 2-dehydropantoate 2-reductase [Chloroflexi bacterium]|nr:2-dehydropantoate 2-reductase [Chloroflexota bacterium]
MGPRIGILGAGAIGGVVGGELTRAGHDVTLIDMWPEHVNAMKANGLTVTKRDEEFNTPVNALHIHELQNINEKFDYGFLAVKSYDTEWAAALIDNYVKDGGAVVDFQNGINDERVAAVVGVERAMACIITIGAGMYEAGHVIRSDAGEIGFKIGEHDGSDTPRAQELVKVMSDVAAAKLTTNMWGDRWSKLAVNCMANPVAGLSGLGSAEVRTDPVASRIAIRMAAEVISVARALGHDVEPIFGIDPDRFVNAAKGIETEELQTDMATGAEALAGGQPSFLQDVLKHRRTEIEFLSGYVSEKGLEAGVATPFCDKIVETVLSHGVGKLEPKPENLAPLEALL